MTTDLFTDADVIHRYTLDNAIADGVLIEPYADWPWLLITDGVASACNEATGGEVFENGRRVGHNDRRTFDAKCRPLLIDCIVAARRPDANAILERDGHLTLDHTVAGTVWVVPNEKGGMTVLLPHEA